MDNLKAARLVNSHGEEVNVNLAGKVIAVYFSAGWCPPCRRFIPLLKELHGELERRKAPFEVVFVSADKTEENMRKYMQEAHGNWPAVSFGDPTIGLLREKFHIEMVPKLVILREDGSVITMNGRKVVEDKGIAAFRIWHDAAHLSPTRPIPGPPQQEDKT